MDTHFGTAIDAEHSPAPGTETTPFVEFYFADEETAQLIRDLID